MTFLMFGFLQSMGVNFEPMGCSESHNYLVEVSVEKRQVSFLLMCSNDRRSSVSESLLTSFLERQLSRTDTSKIDKESFDAISFPFIVMMVTWQLVYKAVCKFVYYIPEQKRDGMKKWKKLLCYRLQNYILGSMWSLICNKNRVGNRTLRYTTIRYNLDVMPFGNLLSSGKTWQITYKLVVYHYRKV